MRLIVVVLALFVVFVLLAQAAPPSLYLPLYCVFTAGGLAYVWWERQRIAERRAELERELAEHEGGRAGRAEDTEE